MRVVIVALLALSSALPEVKTRLKKDAHRVGRGPKFGYSADDGVVASLMIHPLYCCSLPPRHQQRPPDEIELAWDALSNTFAAL